MSNTHLPYLKEILARFRNVLGGSSVLLITAGIIEHYTRQSVSWSIYLWILVLACVIALVVHGSAQHQRLRPALAIKHLTSRVWPIGQAGVWVTGKEYYFDVYNPSEAASLENVRVEVEKMVPDAIGYPNAPLHVRNDDYGTREFSINPGSVRQIDLITGPVNAPRSQQVMIIAHTVNQHRAPIPTGKYRITVRVSAKNVRAERAFFEVWIDHTGELQCVML